jgi:hypothetical protein
MISDEPTPAMQNPEKDPEDWTTGEEPMTGSQRSICKRFATKQAKNSIQA